MIGIFDSGLGGLSVAKEVMRRFPQKKILYFGDTARTPYGNKGEDVVQKFAVECADFLVQEGAEVIVVACNTVSACATDILRSRFNIPIFEVITPTARAAASLAKRRIGVIGTRRTIESNAYVRYLSLHAPYIEVRQLACPLFVPVVEEGMAKSSLAIKLAKTTLSPLRLPRKSAIDTLVLGCTHYPFLRKAIQQALPEVRIIDGARSVANDLAVYIKEHNSVVDKDPHRFMVSDRTEHFERIASEWLRLPIKLEKINL